MFTLVITTSDSYRQFPQGWVVMFIDFHCTVFTILSLIDLLHIVLVFWIFILKIFKSFAK